jgi:hypothetical protein
VSPDTLGIYGGPFTTTLGPPSTIDAFVAEITNCCPWILTLRGGGAAVTRAHASSTLKTDLIFISVFKDTFVSYASLILSLVKKNAEIQTGKILGFHYSKERAVKY